MRTNRVKYLKKKNIVDYSTDNNSDVNNELTPEEIKMLNDTEIEKTSKDFSISKIYYFFKLIIDYVIRLTVFAFKLSGMYLLWICLHYFSAHLYIKFCVPSTLSGFIMSPFMVATPHCQGLRWIVYNAAGIINNMWIIFGAWIYSLIWILKGDNVLNK
jgi:hypothetical protein